jgi:hypothetical protein
MHPAFKTMKLKYPIKAQGSSTLLLADCAPNAQMVKLVYPARVAPKGSKIKYPELEVIWYDGGLQPMKPEGWPAGKAYDGDGGLIFHGSKDTLICGCYGRDPWLLSQRVPVVKPTEELKVKNTRWTGYGHARKARKAEFLQNPTLQKQVRSMKWL